MVHIMCTISMIYLFVMDVIVVLIKHRARRGHYMLSLSFTQSGFLFFLVLKIKEGEKKIR